MNETAATMSDLSEEEQEFVSAVISIIKHRHAKYEKAREPDNICGDINPDYPLMAIQRLHKGC